MAQFPGLENLVVHSERQVGRLDSITPQPVGHAGLPNPNFVVVPQNVHQITSLGRRLAWIPRNTTVRIVRVVVDYYGAKFAAQDIDRAWLHEWSFECKNDVGTRVPRRT